MKTGIQMSVGAAQYLMQYMRYLLLFVVFIGFSCARAGSYEDYFQALKIDDEATVSSLLQRGFDPNTLDPGGMHGLLVAARERSYKAATVLARWPKTQVEVRTKADENPLMLAALHGQLEYARLLVSRGADVNKPGWTPLHYASTSGQVAIIQLLLDNHAYIDASSPNGTTPLMMAAFYGTPSAVKLLLEAGADPLLKNEQALTAIDFAHRNQRQESADIIAAFVRAKQPKGKW